VLIEASLFFFEKKNQKTFANLALLFPGRAAAGLARNHGSKGCVCWRSLTQAGA
jgi:hypothetical protein